MGIDALEWARKVESLGARRRFFLPGMDCDGTKAGYDLELTRAIAEAVSIPGYRVRRCRNHGTLLWGSDGRKSRCGSCRFPVPL